MSEKNIVEHYCDICEMDGDGTVKAVACYTAPEEDADYDVCKKHLEEVKEAKLPFESYKN